MASPGYCKGGASSQYCWSAACPGCTDVKIGLFTWVAQTHCVAEDYIESLILLPVLLSAKLTGM